MQVAGRWLPGMASQVSSGTLGKVHDFSGSRRCPTPAPEVLPKVHRRREASPCDLGKNLQTSGKVKESTSGTSHGPAQSAYRSQKGKNQQWVRQAARAPPTSHTPQSMLLFPSPPRPGDPAYLPHEVVVLADVHVLRSDDTASEGAHLGAGLDPRLGEDAKALAGDGALRDDHLGRQHQAGQLLNLCGHQAGGLGQSGRQGGPALPPPPPPPGGGGSATRGASESKRCLWDSFLGEFSCVCFRFGSLHEFSEHPQPPFPSTSAKFKNCGADGSLGLNQ